MWFMLICIFLTTFLATQVIDVIAKGAYGNVIKVQREDSKRFYAMKVLDKKQIIQEGAIRQCKDEAAIQVT